ncbi:hypothetical protein OHD16_26000 [Sphingobacterium sp. ML3W]|uniref:hypothetical protein n=1 Tax=Sphingobacterium sp. ML3W TaxID=1538644 RepID=UPI00249AF8A2|nr:hypothetical protein [Sphingobacterium sp. ML3W]WFA78159.1 hypothetical protein OGI71_19140 [Sphingobacterium sp. ML3W]
MNKEEQLSTDTILPIMSRGLGLLLAIDMWRLWPDLSMLFGQGTFLEEHSISWQQRPDTLSIHTLISNLPEYTLASLEWIHFFGLLYIICGLALFFDHYRRAAMLGLIILHYLFFIANYTWSYGADYLAQTGLFTGFIFCCFGSRGLRHQRWARLGSTVFRLQLTVVYFFAGLGKAIGPTWWNGEAIWKAIQQPLSPALISIPQVAQQFATIWAGLGIATLLLELGYGLLWINGRARIYISTGIILMHLGIALTMGLIHFSCLMIWYNLCAWDHPLLHRIAKLVIKPLETTEPTLQVRTATADLDTREGGNNKHVK